MAIDVSKMSASELDKVSAKIMKRREELAHQEALAQMKAVAKKHGVDFTEVVRLHNAKLPKASPKAKATTTRKAVAKTARKATTKTAPKPASKTKVVSAAVKTARKAATKTTPKLISKTKVVSKAKYKNPDNPKQTWSGMGRKPAWIVAHLEAGKKLEGLAA